MSYTHTKWSEAVDQPSSRTDIKEEPQDCIEQKYEESDETISISSQSIICRMEEHLAENSVTSKTPLKPRPWPQTQLKTKEDVPYDLLQCIAKDMAGQGIITSSLNKWYFQKKWAVRHVLAHGRNQLIILYLIYNILLVILDSKHMQ